MSTENSGHAHGAARRTFLGGVAGVVTTAALSVSARAEAAGTGDDYPAYLRNAPLDALIDPWSFYNRECTSFAAWRLNQQGGHSSAPWSFLNNMRGPNGVSVHFGNAYQWMAAAQAGGWVVNGSPAVGAVAFWGQNVSAYGHVAIVTAVNGNGTVNVEEYNYHYTGVYSTRSGVVASAYLHIADGANNRAPLGTFDSASGQPGYVTVHGWAFDWDAATSPIAVHIYIGGPAGVGQGTALLANTYRPDVGAAYPGVGNNHGFDANVVTSLRGSQPVYAYAINTPEGNNPLIGQKQVWISTPDPIGNLDLAGSPVAGQIRVAGWSFDLNAPTSPVEINVYVGGPAGTAGAEGHNIGNTHVYRPDVKKVYPQTTNNQGFDTTFITAKRGTVPVYVYALNVPGTVGNNTLLGVITVQVNSPKPLTAAPVPAMAGIARVGMKLTALPGIWGPSPVALRYQWYRAGVAISRATGSTHTLVAADLGKTITVKVTGSKPGYVTASRTSRPTTAVAHGLLKTATPTITGTTRVGYKLTAAPGAWGPAGVSLSYRWYRSGVAVTTATHSTYTLTSSDRGKTMTVKVTGRLAGYTTVTKTSARTATATSALRIRLRRCEARGSPGAGARVARLGNGDPGDLRDLHRGWRRCRCSDAAGEGSKRRIRLWAKHVGGCGHRDRAPCAGRLSILLAALRASQATDGVAIRTVEPAGLREASA